MFRILLICTFVAAVGLFIWHVRAFSKNGSPGLWRNDTQKPLLSIQRLRKNALLLTGASLVLLALSGFLPRMIAGIAPSGLPLLLHVTVAPLFAVSLALWVVLSAHHNAMTENDWRSLLAFFAKKDKKKSAEIGVAIMPLSKICFWIIALLAAPVSLSILLGMTDLLPTGAQETALVVHGYSSLAMFIAAAVLIHLFLAGQPKVEKTNPSPKSKNVDR